jgi:hypothetical protein
MYRFVSRFVLVSQYNNKIGTNNAMGGHERTNNRKR